MKIGFIGCGNMATAMLKGILKSGEVAATDMIASAKSDKTRKKIEQELGIQKADTNAQVVDFADVVFLAVKPQFLEGVLNEIKDSVKEEQIFISIAPGKTLQWLGEHLGEKTKVIRTMPNTPAMVGEGMTALCVNELVTEKETELAVKLCDTFGKTEVIPEHLMDAVVGVSGTEPSIMGTETWTRKGMYFFPDTAFYEFITEKDMMRNYEDPSYIPPTYLMDEVRPGEKYELVFTILKGGAFARYRCGDMYRCVGLENREDETRIPRFEYVDRVPWIIDIAGFTRISENGIRSVIALSKLPIINWVATKEYNEQNRPYLHMYVELERDALLNTAMSTNILKDLLSTYFKYIDQDYRDLKKILGMDPLQVTIFTCGTFEAYEKKTGKKIHQMSPSHYELKELLDIQESLNRVR